MTQGEVKNIFKKQTFTSGKMPCLSLFLELPHTGIYPPSNMYVGFLSELNEPIKLSCVHIRTKQSNSWNFSCKNILDFLLFLWEIWHILFVLVKYGHGISCKNVPDFLFSWKLEQILFTLVKNGQYHKIR